MALISDPDFLTRGTEVIYDTTNFTIELVQAGNLSTDGVTLAALYSFTKEVWKTDADVLSLSFPFQGITPESFELLYPWRFKDDASIYLVRTGGFSELDASGAVERTFASIVSLGDIASSDQPYYLLNTGGAQDFQLTGPVNQCILVFDSAGDDNTGSFKIFAREQAKKYGQSELSDIGETSLANRVYRFPLSTDTDLKVTHSDVVADAYGVTITYYGTPQSRTVGASSYNFDVVIDGNNRTLEEVYEAVQSALRKSTDIDSGAGTEIGKISDELLSFVGDTLVTNQGVFIDNIQDIDINRIEFFDNLGVKRTYPFVSAGTINFNDNLVNEVGQTAIYAMYRTADFGTPSASIVQDSDGNDITGFITGPSVTFSYDYDGQGATDLDVTVVALGLEVGQYVKAEGTITRTVTNTITLVSALERNYTT